jgi:hypothetical protein
VRHAFHPEAALEFEEAVRYYRASGGKLAVRLNAEVRAAIRKITEAPERWGVLEEDVRRCFVRVFPYRVLYTIEPEFILIIALPTTDARRDIGSIGWPRNRPTGEGRGHQINCRSPR